MTDPIDNLPLNIRDEVQSILERIVAGGAARYQKTKDSKTKDTSGLQGQKAISRILQNAGIRKTDPRWIAVIEHGRDLYYGRTVTCSSLKAQPAESAIPPSSSEGPVYTQGVSFRARAEAQQRRFRVETLLAPHGKWGHLLDDRAADAGANFHHPAALQAVTDRMGAGKGVHRARTLGNMLSSQAMCFNIFGPLAIAPGGLELAGELFGPFVPSLALVRTINIEYTPSADVFRDQSGLAGVDCDVLIEFEDNRAQRGILVIETKFVEDAFSSCGHCSKNACPSDVNIGEDFSGCRYASKNGFLYWQRSAEADSVRRPLATDRGCAFSGPLWQIWVNHTLAHAEAARRGATSAFFAVCAPAENDAIENGAVLQQFRQVAADPSTVLFIPLEGLLERLATLCRQRQAWQEWASVLKDRYSVPSSTNTQSARPTPPREAVAVKDGHWRTVQWMATQSFHDLVAVHEAVCGEHADIYFRPTEKGLVRIALHPHAPGYVGFRTHGKDKSHLLTPGSAVPTAPEIEDRLRAFEEWLPTVRRRSKEEQGVIPWIRSALANQLRLPDLGQGWVFLHQEWRFIDELGGSRKSDILAVHGPTGQLGIVEFKSDKSALDEARSQVSDYARFWDRDAAQLAPFFTALLHAMCAAYGNNSAAVTMSTDPAALFVGVASASLGVQVWKR